jgi:ADP-heptose:LPS heptosyltransferase
MIGGAGGLSYCQFEQMAKDAGVHLKIIESCSDDEKFNIISQCKLLLYPSDWEDFGMPPMEVGYYGIPTVAFKNLTYEEAFKDTLIYAKRQSYEDFKDKVKQALNKNELNLEIQSLVFANYKWNNAVINMKRALWKEPKAEEEITILFDIVQGCQERGIGDVLMTTPIIKELKRKFINCRIHYLAHNYNSKILIGNPDVDKIITSQNDLLPYYTYHLTLERKLEDYSIPRNRDHRLDSIAKLFNIELEDRKLVLNLSHEEVEEIRNKYIINNRKKNIVIAFKSSSKYRNWPMTHFYQLANQLQWDYNVYLVDGQEDNYFDGLRLSKNLSGKLDIRELSCLIQCSDLVISLDSACLHIAGALDKKCIALMGPVRQELRCKYYPNCHDISELRRNICVLKSGDCFDLQCGEVRYKCFNKGRCEVLYAISVDDVIKMLKKVI